MSGSSQFSSFFRARRKALGLTLREFCRRNGFDPGNVSRLERGLAAPPHTPDVLESYAQALKIEQGNDEWSLFFELAGAETGRIPVEDQERIRQLPNLLRKLRKESRAAGWVTALHLQAWAESLEARSTLPELVRRLVHATGKEVRRKEFPLERPGWDGIVEAAGIDAFVPQGISGWELGVDKDPKQKAEAEFKKRSKDPLGLVPAETTFIFITARKWQKKADWCQVKQKLGVWKDVRVYDSASLEEWLEVSPAVAAWLARLLGVKPEGLVDIDEYWANLQALTEPSLSETVLLTSQDEAVKEVAKWVAGEAGAIEIEARSPLDALDFFVAFSRQSALAEPLAAKLLIIENKEAWRGLINAHGGELILIAHPSFAVEPELVAQAVRRGHKVVLVSTDRTAKRSGAITLRRANPYDLQKALVACGLAEEKAMQVARKSGGSLTVLKRLLGRFPGTTQPEWCLPENALALVPLLLAGGWDETSELDRAALESLAGRPYSQLADTAMQWLNKADSPLKRVGTRWTLLSRDDSWFLLARNVSAEHLRVFEKVALEVLGESNPAFTFPPDQRWQASLRNQTFRHSTALRTGLTETLALVAVRSSNLAQPLAASGLVDRVVKSLLDNQDWERWASLSAELPVLAEASPDAFVAAAEKDQKRKSPALVAVIEQEGEPMFSSSPHTGLLFALEGLAWERTLLSRVTLVLGWLHENDPGGKLGNRPLNCLKEIFVPWLPQTTATAEERVKVLKRLLEKHPRAGWSLLLSLLPNLIQVSSPNYRPMWQEWTLRWKKGVSNVEYWHQTSACAELLVEHMGNDAVRWQQLIKHYENLPEPARKTFVKRLIEFDPSKLEPALRRLITETIRNKVSDHRRFAGTGWALLAPALRELETVQARLEPDDLVGKNAWLFGPEWSVEEKLKLEAKTLPDAPSQVVAEGPKLERNELGQVVVPAALDEVTTQPHFVGVRCKVLQEILTKTGWNAVLRLADLAESPGGVGFALAEVVGKEYDQRILPALILPDNGKLAMFARSYIWNRFLKDGWNWLRELDTTTWSDEQLGQLLVDLPFEQSPWEFGAERPGVQKYYWEYALPYIRNEDQDPGDRLRFTVSMLLKYRRPWRALNVFSGLLHRKKEIPVDLIMDVLEAGLTAETDNHGSVSAGLKYNVDLLFQYLQERLRTNGPDKQRLAGLEWAYLGVLDGYPSSPVSLHSMLRDNPKEFVGVLTLVYRPKDESEQGRKEFSEEEKARAQNAYRLLASWKELPGSREDGTIDEGNLLEWVRTARSLAQERGLLEICDDRIGGVLAHDREQPGEMWPSDAVKDALEEIGTEAVFDGFRIGVFNKRGAYCKSPDEGGAQERSIAKRYQDYAEASSIEWPKTAAALRLLAQMYEANAKREDMMVEARW